jgi:hypothetical protein
MEKLNEKAAELYEIGFDVFKKPVMIRISEPITKDTIVITLEGSTVVPKGHRIATGTKEEVYGMSPETFQQYDQLEDGYYAKKYVIVRAIKLDSPAFVDTYWGQTLVGKKGDFLVIEDLTKMRIVDQAIFFDTYAYLEKN